MNTLIDVLKKQNKSVFTAYDCHQMVIEWLGQSPKQFQNADDAFDFVIAEKVHEIENLKRQANNLKEELKLQKIKYDTLIDVIKELKR